MWYINLDRFFYRFVTIHVCDRQTDGRTDRILIARPRLHSMQCGKNHVSWWWQHILHFSIFRISVYSV